MVIKRLRVGKSQRAARNMIDLIPNFVMHADGSLFHLHECTQQRDGGRSEGRDVRTHPTKPDRRIAFRAIQRRVPALQCKSNRARIPARTPDVATAFVQKHDE